MEVHNSSCISFPDIISFNGNKTLVTNHITYSFANQTKQSACYDYFVSNYFEK